MDLHAEYLVYLRGMLEPGREVFTVADRLARSRPRWMADAACRGVGADLFFPAQGGSTGAARAYCQRCAVVDECSEYAAANHEVGVWGRRQP